MNMTDLGLEEFEAGENVTDKLRRSKPDGIVISVRLTQEDSATLVSVAEESGKTISQIARQAIRAFLSHRSQRPTFVPEITGHAPNVSIVAYTPLGPRTVKETTTVIENEPRMSRTGYLSAVV